MRRRAIVVGAGHNGLVTGCYLARTGWDVTVLEALDRPGGGSRTEETIPGHRFDVHSVAHNIINMTAIPEELELRQTGLRYLEMDPFSIAVREDQRHVRFHRSVEDTVASIAEHDPVEAEEYRTFVAVGDHLLDAMLPAIRGELRFTDVPRRVLAGIRLLRASSPMELLSPYSTLLRRRLGSDLTRGPIAAFAAHAGVGPNVPGSAAFALWQAAYHRFGQWHGTGGAQNLTDSLIARLDTWGGELRCATPVARIERRGDEVEAVVLEDGERIDADVVVTAIDPKTALLDLLTPALEGQASQDLAAARRSNVVQAVVHVATDHLPAYSGGRPGDANGLQSYVDRLETLEQAWVLAEAGLVPDEVPWYAFSTSAIDDTLAPAGHHTLYLACPAAPAEVRGGWDAERDRFVDSALQAVEVRAPGFRDSVLAVRPWLPSDMMREERWPGTHPMVFDGRHRRHTRASRGQRRPRRPRPTLQRSPFLALAPGLMLAQAVDPSDANRKRRRSPPVHRGHPAGLRDSVPGERCAPSMPFVVERRGDRGKVFVVSRAGLSARDNGEKPVEIGSEVGRQQSLPVVGDVQTRPVDRAGVESRVPSGVPIDSRPRLSRPASDHVSGHGLVVDMDRGCVIIEGHRLTEGLRGPDASGHAIGVVGVRVGHDRSRLG